MLVKKASPFPVECVARGYLSGSGWKEYQQKGSVCGIALPKGLVESSQLPEPIFTPATKATSGHDENISFEQMSRLVGADNAQRLQDYTLPHLSQSRCCMRPRGELLSPIPNLSLESLTVRSS
jgi:phosphoribosylaminoimidazole-succinocarboxamide synthase